MKTDRHLTKEVRGLAPRIHEYGSLPVECADGVIRLALPETTRQYGGRLATLGKEYTTLNPELGFEIRMSLTDGVPIPEGEEPSVE